MTYITRADDPVFRRCEGCASWRRAWIGLEAAEVLIVCSVCSRVLERVRDDGAAVAPPVDPVVARELVDRR